MVRLPIRGSTVAAPRRNEAALRTVLIELCPDTDLGKFDFAEFHGRLSRMIGQWSAEQGRLEISPLVKTFKGFHRELQRIANLLSAQDQGVHNIQDFEAVSHLVSILALNPEVGTTEQANKLIYSFRRDATTLAHACLIAALELDQEVGQRGRPRADWYDDFTALLLDIAAAAGVKPSLIKDRVSGERSGWLMEAAQALEKTFLYRKMRSPSREACGTRLDRSLRTLKQQHRQKPLLTEVFLPM